MNVTEHKISSPSVPKFHIEKPRHQAIKLYRLLFFTATCFLCAGLCISIWIKSKNNIGTVNTPTLVITETGEVRVRDASSAPWMKPSAEPFSKSYFDLKTMRHAQATIINAGQFKIKLKDESTLTFKKPFFILKEGTIDVWTENSKLISAQDIQTDLFDVSFSDTALTVHTDGTNNVHWVSILKGSASIKLRNRGEQFTLHSLDKIIIQQGKSPIVSKITPQEWLLLRNIYDLQSSAKNKLTPSKFMSAESQIHELSNFFNSTSYAQSWVETVEGAPVLKIIYDVSFLESTAGLNLKINPTPINTIRKIHFWIQTDTAGYTLDSIRMELFSENRMVRSFKLRHIQNQWQDITFDIANRKSDLIDQIKFIFSNSDVGNHKQGIIYLKDFVIDRNAPNSSTSPNKTVTPYDLDQLEEALHDLDRISATANTHS